MNTLKFGNGEWYGKKDTILAYNDENSNFKPLPFSFDRDTSATRINKDGLIETVGSGEPRIDYKDDSKGALLLEPSRTNVVHYSDINTAWNQQANIINSLNTDVIAPDGTLNGWKASRNINDNGYTYMLGLGVSTNTIYTASIWLKAYDITICDAVVFNFHPNSFASKSTTFSFENGTANGDGKVEKYSNGWYRLSLTSTSNSTIGYFDIGLQPYLNGSNNWGGQDGDTLFYAYGTQVEEGSYATSYIPTQGGDVTRAAESCSQTVPDGVIGQTEGTIYFETEINGLQGGDMRFQLSDGSTNNWIFISSGEATGIGVKCRAYINNGNVNQFNTYSEYLSAGKHKYALAYNQNDIALYVDGVQVALDTSATIPSLNEITLGGSTPTSTNSSHFLKYDDFKLYNTRLSNAELQALTT